MKLSEIKIKLDQLETICFQLPNGKLVPNHFHVTEVGKITKHFIDCGGTVRNEEVVSFQLLNAKDYDHKLHPKKLLDIIELSEKIVAIPDLEIEVEYQVQIGGSQKPKSSIKDSLQTIGKFGLGFDDTNFLLTTKQTLCLAKDQCSSKRDPVKRPKVKLPHLDKEPCCAPDGNCC